MMPNNDNADKKVKFILAWYNAEKKKLNDKKKLELLNKWIASCTQFEEYEMSNALLNEKRILIRKMRFMKKGPRTGYDVFMIKIKYLIRKIKRKF